MTAPAASGPAAAHAARATAGPGGGVAGKGADGSPGAAMLAVTVVYSPAPRQVIECALRLPAGATVQMALEASGLLARHPDIDLGPGQLGVWGRKAGPDQLLHEADRVEIWRPLRIDPKQARRQRFGQQGARTAGLFAKRRPGAKPGY